MLNRLLVMLALIGSFIPIVATAADDALIAHWRFQGDANDSSGHARHATVQDVDLQAAGPDGATGGAAAFNGRSSQLEVPVTRLASLGTGDFSVLVRVHVADDLDDLPGEIVSQYDSATRRGFRLGIDSRPGVTSSQANWQNVHFGIDAGSEPGEWTDHGRLGNAILIFAMTVFDGQLFAGTCEAGVEEAGRVFRFDGQQWHDCGAPDQCNAISSLAVYDGQLYAASSKYRLRGSALAESENPHPGGTVFRYEGDNQWVSCGTLPDVEGINGLVVFRGKLYAGSLYAPAGFFRYEGGTEWTSCGVPNGKRVESLTVHNGNIYATGYDEGAVYRFDGENWEHLGLIEGATQTYGFATYQSDLYVSEWPHARVFRHGGGTTWHDVGQLGEEKETMPLIVYNGKMYGGTLPLAEVYRYDGDGDWQKISRLDQTPDVMYRRVWSMAVFQGRLFAGTLPSGRVHSVEIGRNVTSDRSLEPGWHHIAAVRETGRLKLYLDGSLTAASTPFAADEFDLTVDQPLRIGFGTTDHFRGRLADLRLYSRSLSADEIRQIAGDR
ncbi:MAG: LamG domain-containing protein [Planctomycetaceae bacterium]|nr:LamG domain-containing protein [Planctomycetaceae bacterium]